MTAKLCVLAIWFQRHSPSNRLPATGAVDGVFGVAVAEVALDQPQVITLVGEVEAAGMAQHVWVDRRQASACGSRSDQIIHRLPGQRRLALL